MDIDKPTPQAMPNDIPSELDCQGGDCQASHEVNCVSLFPSAANHHDLNEFMSRNLPLILYIKQMDGGQMLVAFGPRRIVNVSTWRIQGC